MITEVEINNSVDEQIEITMRGKPEQVIKAMVSGLPREALQQIGEALAVELAKRHDEASGPAR